MKHPTIHKAALMLAYDNGMINRFCSEASYLTNSVAPVLGSVDEADLDALDGWLANLTDTDLEVVICGEYEAATIVAHDCPRNGEGIVLTQIFEDIFDS